MVHDHSTSFLALERDLLKISGIASVSTSMENSRAEYTINFKSRSVALIIAEIDSEVNQVRIRFANNVNVDEWKEESEIVGKLVTLIKSALKEHFANHSLDHNDVPEITVFPKPRNKAGPEIVEQIIMIVQDRELFAIFLKHLNSAKKAKGKIIPWLQHAKGTGWSPGKELSADSKKALPLVLKKISSKGTLQLIEVVDATQRNRQQ